MTQRFEYTVVELREGLVKDRVSGEKLEEVLNEHAREGWQLRTITKATVGGRIGPGGVDGMIVTFERPFTG